MSLDAAAAFRPCLGMAVAGTLVGTLALGAACTSPVDALTGTSADQLASQAFANLDSAKVAHVKGSFVNGERRFTLDCTTDHAGNAQGTIGVNGGNYEVLVTSGQTYVRGHGFWSSFGDEKVARLYGDSWVALQTGSQRSLAGVASPCTLGQTLRDRRFQLTKGGTSRIGREQVVELSDSSGKLYVTPSKPSHLLRMVSSPGYRAPDGSSDVHLDFDYPTHLQVAPPATFIIPSDPKTFPAHYVAEPAKLGKCDASGCAVSAAVHNYAGPAAAQSSATFKLRANDGSDLGSCNVNLPPIDYQQTQEVSCTVSGPAWSKFFTDSTDRQYFAEVSVQNPPYDG